MNLPLFITFIDFKKAFDSINRDRMFAILRHHGIPERIVTAIKTIYTNSKSMVTVDNKNSATFNITTGILQGDVLAPYSRAVMHETLKILTLSLSGVVFDFHIFDIL